MVMLVSAILSFEHHKSGFVWFRHRKGVLGWKTTFRNVYVRILINHELCSFRFQNFFGNNKIWRIAALILLYTFEKRIASSLFFWWSVDMESEIFLLLKFQNINILKVSHNNNLSRSVAMIVCFISKFTKVFESVFESQNTDLYK